MMKPDPTPWRGAGWASGIGIWNRRKNSYIGSPGLNGRSRPPAAAVRWVMLMFTTAGPWVSTRSVKSGSPLTDAVAAVAGTAACALARGAYSPPTYPSVAAAARAAETARADAFLPSINLLRNLAVRPLLARGRRAGSVREHVVTPETFRYRVNIGPPPDDPRTTRSAAAAPRASVPAVRLRLLLLLLLPGGERDHLAGPRAGYRGGCEQLRHADQRVLPRFRAVPAPARRPARPLRPAPRERRAARRCDLRCARLRDEPEPRRARRGPVTHRPRGLGLPHGEPQGLHALVSDVALRHVVRLAPRGGRPRRAIGLGPGRGPLAADRLARHLRRPRRADVRRSDAHLVRRPGARRGSCPRQLPRARRWLRDDLWRPGLLAHRRGQHDEPGCVPRHPGTVGGTLAARRRRLRPRRGGGHPVRHGHRDHDRLRFHRGGERRARAAGHRPAAGLQGRRHREHGADAELRPRVDDRGGPSLVRVRAHRAGRDPQLRDPHPPLRPRPQRPRQHRREHAGVRFGLRRAVGYRRDRRPLGAGGRTLSSRGLRGWIRRGRPLAGVRARAAAHVAEGRAPVAL